MKSTATLAFVDAELYPCVYVVDSDDDFVALVSKKANPQQLFMSGKMKLKGNMALAMKFEQVLKSMPQPPQSKL